MSEDERDPSFEAAWRRASREEPSSALDAAIRAAARHTDAGAAGRGRDRHWWYPLAAAATVALLAVGIAQLTPPERIEPSVTDMAAAPSKLRGAGAAPAGATDANVALPPATPPNEPPPAPAPGVGTGPVASERVRPSPASGPQRPAANAQAQDQIARPAERAAANSPPVASLAASAPTARPLSEPFPAPAMAPPRREGVHEETSQAANAPAQEATDSMQGPSRMAAARVASANAVKGPQVSTRTVDDWIKRIRELKNADRLDEAATELAAFRTLYGERADALLPPDLRQIKP